LQPPSLGDRAVGLIRSHLELVREKRRCPSDAIIEGKTHAVRSDEIERFTKCVDVDEVGVPKLTAS
jgi:hypothetical protein